MKCCFPRGRPAAASRSTTAALRIWRAAKRGRPSGARGLRDHRASLRFVRGDDQARIPAPIAWRPGLARCTCNSPGRTYELSDLLVNRLQVTDVGARFAAKVTYHYACHLRGLGLTGQCETLLKHVAGLTLCPAGSGRSVLRLWRLVCRPLSGNLDRDGRRQGPMHRADGRRRRREHGHRLPDEYRRALASPRQPGTPIAPGRVSGE